MDFKFNSLPIEGEPALAIAFTPSKTNAPKVHALFNECTQPQVTEDLGFHAVASCLKLKEMSETVVVYFVAPTGLTPRVAQLLKWNAYSKIRIIKALSELVAKWAVLNTFPERVSAVLKRCVEGKSMPIPIGAWSNAFS
jgi:hypothetical protein